MGAFLRSFTDGPVLAIDQVPEVDRVAGVEVWLLHHARIEVPIAFNRGVRRASGPESMDHEIVRMKTEEHVREDEVIVDAVPIFLRHPLQGRPLRVARPHHRRVVLRELHEAAVEIAGSRLPCEICCVGPGRVVRDPVQVWVDRGAVIALGIVLPEDFPIRLDLVGLAGPEAEILERESPKPGKELTHLFGEVGCPIVQIRPDESAPSADPERAKAVILLPEIHERLRVGRPDEPSLNRIGPCVVGADEGSELLSSVNTDDARPSVPAHVVESADLAVFPPDEQERLVSNLPHEKIPRVRNLIRATDVQPAAEIEPLELFADRRLVPEGFPRQQGRGREVLSGLDVRTSFRNLGLLHPFRSRYSEDSFGVFAAIEHALDVGSRRLCDIARCVVQPERLRSRGDRRPFRPPWRKRFSLGRESFGGRSFRFFTLLETQWSQKQLSSNSLEPKFSLPVSGLFLAVNEAQVGFLIKSDGIPAPLRERKNPTNASESVRSVVPGAALANRPLALAFKVRFGRSLWKSLHRMADGWPCARCRPEMTIWMQGLHDAVNVRLGKRPFRPDSYARYVSGSLERGFHSGCLGCRVARAGSRFLARAPRPQIQTP